MVLNARAFRVMVCLAFLANLGVRASAAPVGSSCNRAVAEFVSRPTESTLAALARSDEDGCWSVVGISNATQDQLNHWAERGNRWAAQYLAKHLKQLDGGNLEDTLTALGQFSDHDMERFMLFVSMGLLSKREFTDAITSLPLSLSENPRALLAMLSTRRRKLMNVAGSDLSDQKTQALNAIDDLASEIRSQNPQGAR